MHESRDVGLPGSELEIEIMLTPRGLTAIGGAGRTSRLAESERAGQYAVTQEATV
jgi:hypothetical protein